MARGQVVQLMYEEQDTLERWQAEGNRQIPVHFDEFSARVARARDFASRGNHNAATIYGEVAALYAISWHSGIFVSAELERILVAAGRRAIKREATLRR